VLSLSHLSFDDVVEWEGDDCECQNESQNNSDDALLSGLGKIGVECLETAESGHDGNGSEDDRVPPE